MCAWGLSPSLVSSSQASWPRGGGKRNAGGRPAAWFPKFHLLGAGGVDSIPHPHSPLPQPSSPEKLAQLFCSVANSFFLCGGSAPGLEAPGRPTLRGPGWGRSLSPRTAHCRRRPLPRRRPDGIWVSGRASDRSEL